MAQVRRSAVVVAIMLALLGTPVLAHSGLGAASPAPGTTVGGEITEIQLRYSSTVENVSGSITDPDGVELTSEFVQDGNLKVTILLAARLDTPGEHTVRHISTDVTDRDRVDASYRFTFDPVASPPQLQVLPEGDGGFKWIRVVLGGGIVVIGVLTWRLLAAVTRSKRLRGLT